MDASTESEKIIVDEGTVVKIVVEFSGGLEVLFDGQCRHELSIPATDPNDQPATMGFLIDYICDHVMKDSRKELFVVDGQVMEAGGQVSGESPSRGPGSWFSCCGRGRGGPLPHRRPGILVLINDADWELDDEERYRLQAGDSILFVSTLHGG